MSDLTGGAGGAGRAANGGARTTGGPVPVAGAIRTPQMIMNDRRQRDARRQAEADAARAAEEQRKAEEERRKSAERRSAAAGVTGQTGREPGPQRQPQTTATYHGPPLTTQAPAATGYTATSQAQGTTAGSTFAARARASSQPGQPRLNLSQPIPAPGDARRPPQAPQSHARQPTTAAGPSQTRAGPSTAQSGPQAAASTAGTQQGQPRATSSSFPRSFERWEMLSSHWEGLTSYWIRRLETNTEELRGVPLAQQMSRQITDLSAAGANLFHAVVELQRLRASSERKFQRWLDDYRQEQERAQEREAQLEHTLRVERDARAQAVNERDTEKKNADRMVAEMRRELQISKEEARRAWEELGRREQEERDRTASLREGQPTLVGGVQVVPMVGGMSRHGSVSQRPHGQDDGYLSSMPAPSGTQRMGQQYSYEEAQSPTDTDPFAEGPGHAGGLRHEPDVPSLVQGTYVPTGAAGAATRAGGSSQPSQQAPVPAPLHPHHHTSSAQQADPGTRTSIPEAFYQQPEAYLHRETATSIPEDERSYVTSQAETSDGEEDYVQDDNGNYILDEAGHRVPYSALREQDSDEFDVREDRRRELEHLQRYGTAAVPPSSYATTSGGAYESGYSTSNVPDYSGAAYGSEWPAMRHHHPTRLSDVPEEDERSRTSPSRASLASRGMY